MCVIYYTSTCSQSSSYGLPTPLKIGRAGATRPAVVDVLLKMSFLPVARDQQLFAYFLKRIASPTASSEARQADGPGGRNSNRQNILCRQDFQCAKMFEK
jgi:hypothetical protein